MPPKGGTTCLSGDSLIGGEGETHSTGRAMSAMIAASTNSAPCSALNNWSRSSKTGTAFTAHQILLSPDPAPLFFSPFLPDIVVESFRDFLWLYRPTAWLFAYHLACCSIPLETPHRCCCVQPFSCVSESLLRSTFR